VESREVELVSDFVKANLPGALPEPVSAETCLYASTPDDDFVLDRVGPVVLGVGFGGHGFKFAPAVGSMLADLAEGRPVEPAARFAVGRFASQVHAG